MTIYYSANPRGFYDDADFGPRTTQVPDPQWIQPTKNIELLPGDSIEVDGEVTTNTSEVPITVPGVLDESAVHPLITVDNPYCRIPVDAVPISNERHVQLLEGQAEGKLIREDAEGNPILVDLPPPSSEQMAAAERSWRNGELLSTDRIVNRHRDELDLTCPTTLTTEQFTDFLDYRQQLRDWPASADFPDPEKRPTSALASIFQF